MKELVEIVLIQIADACNIRFSHQNNLNADEIRHHGQREHGQQDGDHGRYLPVFGGHSRYLPVLLHRHVTGRLRGTRPRGHRRPLADVVVRRLGRGTGLLEEEEDVQVCADEDHDADLHDDDRDKHRLLSVKVGDYTVDNSQAPYDADADDGASSG